MKLPLKYIALLVILSLAGVFAYQTYWLTSLYRTQRSEMEKDIREALRTSDYNEMIVRVRRLQNDSSVQTEVTVSTGYDNERAFTKTHTIRSSRATAPASPSGNAMPPIPPVPHKPPCKPIWLPSFSKRRTRPPSLPPTSSKGCTQAWTY